MHLPSYHSIVEPDRMSIVTISPKFQIVIPREVRERLKLVPGQQLQVLEVEGHLTLSPVRPMSEYRGFLAGTNAIVDREDDAERV